MWPTRAKGYNKSAGSLGAQKAHRKRTDPSCDVVQGNISCDLVQGIIPCDLVQGRQLAFVQSACMAGVASRDVACLTTETILKPWSCQGLEWAEFWSQQPRKQALVLYIDQASVQPECRFRPQDSAVAKANTHQNGM